VPVRSPERLADAMRRLAEEPARRARLATAGRRQVETSFTIQRMVAEYIQLYQRVLGSH
jgi:glycosyltransferase involved in cell wall biosynthesis